ADPNKTGQLGITALHQAAYKGKELIVKLLLQRGADANIKDQLDRKPIDMAKEGGYDSIVKLLQPRTTP
ncbi:MAG: ankyrin repeat domain-containing protein, partial [Bacteroidota bacterium]